MSLSMSMNYRSLMLLTVPVYDTLNLPKKSVRIP